MNLKLAYLLESMNIAIIASHTFWNSLDNYIKQFKSCNGFKHKVKDKFFKVIKTKEDEFYKY